jgi:hypothetical protein
MAVTVNNNAGSQIGQQVNIDNNGTVYIGDTPRMPASADELRSLIDALWLQVNEARQRGEIPADRATQAKAKLAAAAKEAKQDQPSATKVRENLEGAKLLIDGLAAAAGLLPAFTTAAAAVQTLLR